MSKANLTEYEYMVMKWKEQYQMTSDIYYVTLGIPLVVVCVIGVIANLLSITMLSMVVRKSKLPVYRCFLGLSVADFMVCLLQIIDSSNRYLDREHPLLDDTDAYNAPLSKNWLYHFVRLFQNIFFAASNWSIVLMSVFRFIAVFQPLLYQRFFTGKIVNWTIVAIYVISVALNIPLFITLKSINDRNTVVFYFQESTRSSLHVISVMATQVVPLGIVTLLLLPLVIKICTHKRIQTSMSRCGSHSSKDKAQTSVTLILISIFFVVFLGPSVIYRFWKSFLPDDYKTKEEDTHTLKKLTIFYSVLNIFLLLNYVANFFFYILLNERLRGKLKIMIGVSKYGTSKKGLHWRTSQFTMNTAASPVSPSDQTSVTGSHPLLTPKDKKVAKSDDSVSGHSQEVATSETRLQQDSVEKAS